MKQTQSQSQFPTQLQAMQANTLNPAQREAISYLDGPLLVLAGAGSGKTRVIVQKLAYLVEKCGYSPRNIAAITFTNKAANEMRERIGKLLSGKDAKGMTICTFHALGMQILREEASLLGYKKSFSIFDTADTGKIISELAHSQCRFPVLPARYPKPISPIHQGIVNSVKCQVSIHLGKCGVSH